MRMAGELREWVTRAAVVLLVALSAAVGAPPATAASAPANDFFASANVVTQLPYVDTGVDTALATTEPNEPRSSCAGVGEAIAYDVWYKVVAPVTTTITAMMAPANFTSNNLYGIVVAYQGTDLTTLTEVGCADSATKNSPVHVAFQVTAGQTYYVQAGSWLLTPQVSGIFTMTIEGQNPPNDFFAFANVVTQLPYLDAGVNTAQASIEPNEPRNSCAGVGEAIAYDVWYKLVAPTTTTVTAGMTPSTVTSNNMYGIVVAYQGTDLNALTEVGCASSGTRNAPVSVAFQVAAGQTYYVQVGSWLLTPQVPGIFTVSLSTPAAVQWAPTTSALGNTTVGPFSFATKIQSRGGYITWRVDGGTHVANQVLQVWVYKKYSTHGRWYGPTLLTTRRANSNGVAYLNIRSGSVLWLSLRAKLPATGATAASWGPTSIGRWR